MSFSSSIGRIEPSRIPIPQNSGRARGTFNKNGKLQIKSIYGFGTISPDYLLHEKQGEKVCCEPLDKGATGLSSHLTSKPQLSDDTTGCTPCSANSMPAQDSETAKTSLSPVTSYSLNTMRSKRGRYPKVPGGDPFQFHYDTTTKDPLTIQPAKSGEKGELMNATRRIRRPSLSTHLLSSNSLGTAEALKWS